MVISAIPIELERDFNTLVEQWYTNTLLYSSIQDISMDPAYQQIIGMGSQVLPLIFRELPEGRSLWFWALHAITREDPVGEDESGDQAVEAWLIWGKERGYTR